MRDAWFGARPAFGYKLIFQKTRESGARLSVAGAGAFSRGGDIPVQYTCEGENISPQLVGTEAPETTKPFAIIVEDHDTPGGIFNRWLV